MERDYLALKWGTLKSWEFKSERSKRMKAPELLSQYRQLGFSCGAASQRDTTEQKKIICKLIDAGNFTRVFLDWDGKWVSKTKAKKYVMEY